MTASDLWPAPSTGPVGLPRERAAEQLPDDQLSDDVSVRIRVGSR